jgi:hypothetical protein
MEAEAPDEYDINDDQLICCQGTPKCPYKTIAIQKAIVEAGGCVWCEKIWFDSNGDQQARLAPGEA